MTKWGGPTTRATARSAAERMAILIKAWNAWIENKPVTDEVLTLAILVDEERETRRLDECPIVGGIDLGNPKDADESQIQGNDPDPETIEARATAVRTKKTKTTLTPSRAGEEWAAGDVAWVYDKGTQPPEKYKATILGDPWETDGDGGSKIMVSAADGEWEVSVGALYLEEPDVAGGSQAAQR